MRNLETYLLENNFLVSSITVAELFTRVRDEDEINYINSLLVIFDIIDVNALIAATIIEMDVSLVTLNVKHYSNELNIMIAYSKI